MGDHWVLPALDYTALGCRICEVTTTLLPGEQIHLFSTLVNGKCINSPYAFVFVYGLLELRIQKDFKRYLVPRRTWCLNVTSVFSWSHQMASAILHTSSTRELTTDPGSSCHRWTIQTVRKFFLNCVSHSHLSASVLPSGETEQIYSFFSRKALQTVTASGLEGKSLWSF